MSDENVHEILERVSKDHHFRKQFLNTLTTKSKEDDDLKHELLDALGAGSKTEEENTTAQQVQAAHSHGNLERTLQLALSGILVALFVVIAGLTLVRIDAAPKSVIMGDRMEMYDPFVRAKDLLTLLIPLFTTIVSFWLGFSIQEKKVTQERVKREKADEMMAKIKGRTMMPSANDDVAMLRDHIHEIMEVPKQGE
jgi:hypothetical protein